MCSLVLKLLKKKQKNATRWYVDNNGKNDQK